MSGNSLKKIIENIVTLFVSETRRIVSFLRTRALTETGLISVFLLLFAGNILFLDMKIGNDLDPNTDKSWWTLSFETRNPDSLEFAIENHSENTHFSYEVTRNKIILDKGAASVMRGERKNISPHGIGDIAGRTLITIESEDGSKKSIYRDR